MTHFHLVNIGLIASKQLDELFAALPTNHRLTITRGEIIQTARTLQGYTLISAALIHDTVPAGESIWHLRAAPGLIQIRLTSTEPWRTR